MSKYVVDGEIFWKGKIRVVSLFGEKILGRFVGGRVSLNGLMSWLVEG